MELIELMLVRGVESFAWDRGKNPMSGIGRTCDSVGDVGNYSIYGAR